MGLGRFITSIASAGILCAGTGSTTLAQSNPKLSIVIDGVDADAKACGIFEDTLRSPAALTLRQNGVSADKLTNPYLYINIIVLAPRENRCNFSLSVQVLAISTETSVGAFKTVKQYANLVLCEKAGVVTVNKVEAGRRAVQNVEDMTKLCLGSLVF
jgi:hypothetical protein